MEELRTLVLETGYLPQKHQSILVNLFDLQAITVDDVMVPRNQIESIDLEAPLDAIAQQAATAYHRRLLAYTGEPDEIAGILRARHVLNLVQQGSLTRERLRKLVREAYYVPSGTPLFSQLQNFQRHQDRIALVVDEYGDLRGLVTLEDILEEIIGEFTTTSPLRNRLLPARRRQLCRRRQYAAARAQSEARLFLSAGRAQDRKWPDSGAPAGHSRAEHEPEDRSASDRNRADAGPQREIGTDLSGSHAAGARRKHVSRTIFRSAAKRNLYKAKVVNASSFEKSNITHWIFREN